MRQAKIKFNSNAAPVERPMRDLLLLNLSRGRSAMMYRLELSIRDSGMIRLPLAADNPAGRPVILSGRRRIEALSNIGCETVPIIFLPPLPGEEPSWTHPECPEAVLYPSQIEIAMVENYNRGFNHGELPGAADLLRSTPDSPVKTRLMSHMGLSAPHMFETASLAAALPEAFLDGLAQGVMELQNLREMRDWTLGEKMALLDLFMRLKPGHQKRRVWIEYLNDLKARDSLDLAPFLEAHFAGLEHAGLEEEARARLFRLRFPKLGEILTKRDGLIKSLKLPEGVSFTLDPAMEDPSAALRIDFSNPEHLRDQLTELLAIVSSSARLKKLFSDDWESG